MKDVARRLIVLVLAVGLLAGCSGVAASGGETVAVVAEGAASEVQWGQEVSPEVVASLNAEGQIVVIDVREAWEYDGGHIPGALLIPLAALPDRVDEIPTDQPVVLACRSGNRSMQAHNFLQQQGFDNVHNMTGGMIAWQAAGLDIER